MRARKLPGKITAHGEADKICTVEVSVELGGLHVEGFHGDDLRVHVSPVMVERALRNHDDKGPALWVVAQFKRQAVLRLPQSISAALTAPMQKENDGPMFAVVAL